jgi:hypothetical protein
MSHLKQYYQASFLLGKTKIFVQINCLETMFPSHFMTRDAVFLVILFPGIIVSGFILLLVVMFPSILIMTKACFKVIELGGLHVMTN